MLLTKPLTYLTSFSPKFLPCFLLCFAPSPSPSPSRAPSSISLHIHRPHPPLYIFAPPSSLSLHRLALLHSCPLRRRNLPIAAEMAVAGRHIWSNQSHLLHVPHAPAMPPSPEVIVVSLPVGPEAFDLLCWTINVAARPRDSVVAFLQQQQQHGASQEFVSSVSCKSDRFDDAQFKPLQGLCDMKKVHLEARISRSGSEERLLVDEVVALDATMLVVTTSGGHHLQRRAQRKGRYLCKDLPSGCSLVVVRDYKVLFYKDNRFRATQKSCITRDRGSTIRIQAMAFTLGDSENDAVNDASVSYNKTPPQVHSPVGVLDGPDVFDESDDGADSGYHPKLRRSLSKKSLITCGISSHGEDDIMCLKQQNSCLNIWRKRKQTCRSFTFPAAVRHFRLAPIFIHCKSFGTSFRAYVSSLWVPRSLKTVNASTSLTISDKSWRIFSYEEVSRATNKFSEGNLIGKGGHSEVYKGTLHGSQQIAVKRLIQAEFGDQKTIDFLTELGLICHTSHPNIIRLVGFCVEKGSYLVFHFLEHGSLASCLYGRRTATLKWEIRYKVAVGTARGLNYLHSQCPRRIIHRDIKASNILLGPDFEPQISDFGLAKWLPDQRSHHVPMPIEGTFGYLAPEYFMHGVVDEKTDVFAFGVLLLELITGRKPIEDLRSSLVVWARPFFESMDIQGLADVHLHGEYDPQEMQSMMMAAALCVQPLPQCRPSMTQVLQLLSDERKSNGVEAIGIFSSQSLYLQDPIFNDEYNSTHYHNDMRRHREIALQF